MNCEKCPFKAGTPVEGEGSRVLKEYFEERTVGTAVFKSKVVERDSTGKYDVVCVGMAPAREEVREGRPFVGVSGQILRRTLAQMGITEYYVCNIFLCPITDDGYISAAKSCCRDVIPEILGREPKLVIALGDLPLRILTTNLNYTITELEGRVIPSKVGPLLPLLHPAYYWRRPPEFFDFIEGMRSGVRFLNGTYTQCGDPTLTVVTAENLSEVLQEVGKYDEVGVDLETNGLSPYGWEPNKILEMGLAVTPDHAYIVPESMIEAFKDILEEKKGIFHNAQFDAAFLKTKGISANVSYDTLLAHYSIDERPKGHGLKRVAKIYLGCDDWEKGVQKYLPRKKSDELIDYSIIPTDVRYEYLSKDVTRTLQLKSVLDPMVNRKVFDRLLMPATRMFIDIEERGMRIDPVLLMKMEPELAANLERLELEIRELTGKWINPNSPQQVKELLYGEMGLPIDSTFGESTGKDALAPYSSDPLVSKILDYRQIAKMRNGYVLQFAQFVDRNYRIHPKINLYRTITGRLSSSDPSIMNIKGSSKLKEIFLPDEGSVLGYGDIKGNELRWYCIHAMDEKLIQVLKDGGDPHNVVATVAFGAEHAKEMRTSAKTVVFGRMYGRSRKSIEYQVGSEVIDKLMKTVDEVFPKVKSYKKDILEELGRGYLESYFGRLRRFPLITPEFKNAIEREAVNFKPQSGGSDLMLLCMLHLWDLRNSWGIWPFWPVHDSITSNIPDKGLLPKMKKELETYSEDLTGNILPFVWEMDWGLNWAMQKGD